MPPPEDASFSIQPRSHGNDDFSLKEVLQIVFTRPQMLLFLLQGSLRRALLRLILISFACGVIAAISDIPSLIDETMTWSKWLQQNVQHIEISDTGLSWQHPVNLPATLYFRGWRVDFRPADAEKFDTDAPPGTYPRGIWISPEKAFLWWRGTTDTEARTQAIFRNGKVLGNIDPGTLTEESSLTLDGAEFEAFAKRMLWYFVPGYLLAHGAGVTIQLLFYVGIFAIIPYLLKSPLAAGGLNSIFTFYLYTSLPALVVATVYNAVGIQVLDFSTIFIIVFIGYLVLVMWRLGNAAKAS